MFNFRPTLPDHWQKRIVRHLLHKLDFLEERTLGDLSNLEGSVGKNSVFTVRDVGIKVDRLTQWLKSPLPPRITLTEAVIGKLTIRLPGNFVYSGSIEIVVADVKISAAVASPKPPDVAPPRTPPPPRRRRSEDQDEEDDEDDVEDEDEEIPTSAEDLAQSFLHSQTQRDQDMLLKSMYQEAPPHSSTASLDEEDEEEVGVGESLALPGFFTNMFKGIGDRLQVKIRGVVLSLDTLNPTGETTTLEFHIEDADVEGVTASSVTPLQGEADASSSHNYKLKKDGKRRITLDNIRAYIVTDAAVYEPPSLPVTSTIFGTESEASTATARAGMEQSRVTIVASPEMQASVAIVRDPTPPLPSPPPPPAELPQPKQQDPDPETDVESDHSESDRFADIEDSDEEGLAFVPRGLSSSISHLSSSTPHPSSSISHPPPPPFTAFKEYEYETDSEEEGGATFSPSIPEDYAYSPDSTPSSPPLLPLPKAVSKSPEPEPLSDPLAESQLQLQLQPPLDSNASDMDSSDGEMDPEASRMLSESTLFSHTEAGSLYMSAMSGVLRSDVDELLEERRYDARDEEEIVDEKEVDERLDRLIGIGNEESTSATPVRESGEFDVEPEPENTPARVENRQREKKMVFVVDMIEIFLPSLSTATDSTTTMTTTATEDTSTYSPPQVGMDDSVYASIPGAFSMYASRNYSKPPPPPPTPISPPQQKKKQEDGHADQSPSAGKLAEIEVFVGRLELGVDISTGKSLGSLFESLSVAFSEQHAGKRVEELRKEGVGTAASIGISVGDVDIRLHEPDVDAFTPGEIILQCLFHQIKVLHTPLPDSASSSKIEVRKFALRDSKEDILSFIPKPPSTAAPGKKKRHSLTNPSAPPPPPENDLWIVIAQNRHKRRINVSTLPIKVHFNLQRLEETLGAFGGFGSVLASTSASTATITRPKPKSTEVKIGSGKPAGGSVDSKVDARFGGIFIEILGSTGRVVLETSAIRLKSGSGAGVVIGVEKIELYGPYLPSENVPASAASLLVENTRVEFLDTPEQEDLGHLLELVTPSRHGFDKDDILIHTLLRQREQGSVLKISTGKVSAQLLDLKALDRFGKFGEEVMKVVTVTDFVAQDDRPGLLTLCNVETFAGLVQVGGGMGRIEAKMQNVGIAHVTLPSLVALAVGRISVIRNSDEEIMGQGLENGLFPKTEEGRPMLRVRIIGDEPEPVVKLLLWNIRIEYRVTTLIEIMEASAEMLAQEMVESIVLAAERVPVEEKASLRVDAVVEDSVIGLNPLSMHSRALLILTASRLEAGLPSGGKLEASLKVKKASVMLIDDIANLVLTPSTSGHTSKRHGPLTDHLTVFSKMGYVSFLEMSSMEAFLKIVESGPNCEKAVDLEVRHNLVVLESCADSTQTMLSIVNGLKPPMPEEEEVKYRTSVMSLDMFKSITEDAFASPHRRKAKDMGVSIIEEDDETDLLVTCEDDVPMNLTFVESPYGYQSPNGSRYPKDDLAESMLSEDLDELAAAPSESSSKMLASFTEEVHMLDDSPMNISEDHFGNPSSAPLSSSRRKGKQPQNKSVLNGDTISKWDSNRKCYIRIPIDHFHSTSYIPLRIRIRDVQILWNLHDGYDWQRTRDTISQAVKKLETKVSERRKVAFADVDDDEESVVEDFLFNSIYVGIPPNRDRERGDIADYMSETSYASTSGMDSRPSSRSRADPGGGGSGGWRKNNLKLGRSSKGKMQFELKGVSVDFYMFPPGGETQSSIDVKVGDLEIFDNVPTSTWRKFVTYMQDAGTRETGSSMLHLEILNVRPVPELAASEIVLKVTVLPLRLHVDQDTLDFLTRFFEFKDDTAVEAAPAEIPFLQRVEINSVRIKLDYKPKKVDYAGLRSGHTTEFMNFFILDEADMVLRHVVLYGISGFPRMSKLLNDTWMPDIKNNQLGGVLAGLAPARSLVNIGSGVKDLVIVPVREYRKDGRLIRSLQRGAAKFAKTTTSELVRLGAKVANGTQTILENAEGFMIASPMGPAHPTTPSSSSSSPYNNQESDNDGFADLPPHHQQQIISLYSSHPTSVSEGLRTASRGLQRNFRSAGDAIRGFPAEIAELGAAKAIVRTAPVAVLRPMIGVTMAAAKTLQGVEGALDPDVGRRVGDKYKRR